MFGWRQVIYGRPSLSWLLSFQKNVSGSLDWRRLPRVANQFWNQASTTRWLEDEKTAQKFCTFVGLLGPPDNSKKKRSSKFAKFCTFSWLVVSTWSEFDSKLKSFFAGDDDIRLGHDLHHVSHYNHQVIWDYVFHLIRIFSIGPFQYHQPHFMYINSIRSINLWTEPQSMYFIQNLYWLGRYHRSTETD